METTQMEKLSVTDPEFIAWMEACQKMIDEQCRAFTPGLYEGKEHTKLLVAEQGSKFIRILTVDGQRMAWAFVARFDDTTKIMGTVKKGDIFKTATWKAPAKYARGSIYQGGTGGVTRWTGPDYLR